MERERSLHGSEGGGLSVGNSPIKNMVLEEEPQFRAVVMVVNDGGDGLMVVCESGDGGVRK